MLERWVAIDRDHLFEVVLEDLEQVEEVLALAFLQATSDMELQSYQRLEGWFRRTPEPKRHGPHTHGVRFLYGSQLAPLPDFSE